MLRDFERIREIKRGVEGGLLAIPGVHAVGVGRKLVAGQMTDDSCIMVFVVAKKPAAEIPAAELIPAEINGVKTDVYECPIPRNLAGGDTDRERPLFGGVQVWPGGVSRTGTSLPRGLGGLGTLACLAVTGDAQPKLVAITCRHVLDTPVQATKSSLNIAYTAPNITLSGANLAGSLVVVNLDTGTGNTLAFYRTSANDTLQTIAAAVVTQITGSGIVGLTAAVTPAGSSTIQLTSSSAPICQCFVFDPATGFQDAGINVSVSGTAISLAGQASQACAAYLRIDLGGQNPTYGVFVPIAAGANASTVASSFLAAVTALKTNVGQPLSSLTVSTIPPSQPGVPEQVSFSGVQAIECFVASDNRVGQPDNSFCSKCCKSCDDRIGVVIDARLDVDAAIIQIDPAYVSKYRAEIYDIGAVKGVHDIHTESPGYPLQKSGITTGQTHGTLMSLDVSGIATTPSDPGITPPWRVYTRTYKGAFNIAGAGFSDEGDSGAAIVTDKLPTTDPSYNQVAGILFSGAGGVTYATPIQSVLSAFPALKLSLATATAAGVDVPVPAVATTTPRLAPALGESLGEITATKAGREYHGLVRRHLAEAQTLVNSNRRVATVWHRNGGPEILNGVLAMTRSPQARLPSDIRGRPLVDRLRRIKTVFIKYCSPRMAEDLELHAEMILRLTELTFSELIEVLSKATPLPATEYHDGR